MPSPRGPAVRGRWTAPCRRPGRSSRSRAQTPVGPRGFANNESMAGTVEERTARPDRQSASWGGYCEPELDITWIMGVMTGRDVPYGRRVAPLPLPCGDRGEERGNRCGEGPAGSTTGSMRPPQRDRVAPAVRRSFGRAWTTRQPARDTVPGVAPLPLRAVPCGRVRNRAGAMIRRIDHLEEP